MSGFLGNKRSGNSLAPPSFDYPEPWEGTVTWNSTWPCHCLASTWGLPRPSFDGIARSVLVSSSGRKWSEDPGMGPRDPTCAGESSGSKVCVHLSAPQAWPSGERREWKTKEEVRPGLSRQAGQWAAGSSQGEACRAWVGPQQSCSTPNVASLPRFPARTRTW